MAFAIVLYFDPSTEAKVQALWETLAEQGVSSVMATMDIRPHISLAGWEGAAPETWHDELADLAAHTAPLITQLSAVGTFPTDQGVVYLAPVVTAELVKLHETFHARLSRLGISSFDYYRPASWVPHCTVAINLPPEGILATVDACRKSRVFGPARLTEVALVEYLPVKEICVFPFGGMAHAEPH
jgi:2'-5' RNA ligase